MDRQVVERSASAMEDASKIHSAMVSASAIANHDDVNDNSNKETGNDSDSCKKGVSFSRKVTMVCMPHKNDFSLEDRLAMWYTRDELRAMRSQTLSQFRNLSDIAC